MRLLLDTHAVIWFFQGNKRLSHTARRAIENPRSTVFVSAVSGYEIATKSIRTSVEPGVLQDLAAALRTQRMDQLAITMEHMVIAGELPGPHRDPWDRILMAQAKTEALQLVSCDPVFEHYRMRVLW